jgi:hypothetical protein
MRYEVSNRIRDPVIRSTIRLEHVPWAWFALGRALAGIAGG